jgi:Ca2+-dependent lipid-binding protein
MGLWSDEASALKNSLQKSKEALKARTSADESSTKAQRNTKWVLTVGLVGCQDLPKMDRMGAADPYVTIDIPGHDQQRSKTLKNTLWPQWGGEQFVFAIQDDRRQMEVTVWDWNRWSGDNKIGKVRFWLAELSGKKTTESYEISLPPNSKQSTACKQENHATITLSLSASNAVVSEEACRGVPLGAAARNQPAPLQISTQPPDSDLVPARRAAEALPQVKKKCGGGGCCCCGGGG